MEQCLILLTTNDFNEENNTFESLSSLELPKLLKYDSSAAIIIKFKTDVSIKTDKKKRVRKFSSGSTFLIPGLYGHQLIATESNASKLGLLALNF
ncbi:unnamed protein product [Ambrosiozyma monospora]|uniref:Unnamed protein product n=1 Tax=Ambrosiozyma monospora TaxID=43982 RepID=A0ACB5SUB7_AMBMO|nr:unnamed protein product [Ambrosiozyma monospora]